MIGHAAHRDVVSFGQREVKKSRGDLGIFKEELVEVTEPKEEQGIRGNARTQPLILLHHGSESVSHDGRNKMGAMKCQLLFRSKESKNPDELILTGVSVLATSYSRTTYRCTTIGAAAFHFRVRNGNGWGHCARITRREKRLRCSRLVAVASAVSADFFVR